MERQPIICRVPVYCTPQSVRLWEPELSWNKYTPVYTSKGSEEVQQQIAVLRQRDQDMCLVVEDKIRKPLVWQSSYKDNNLILFKLSIEVLSDVPTWVDRLVVASNKCGIRCVFYISPVLPGYNKMSQVLALMDKYRFLNNIDYVLGFGGIYLAEQHDNWINAEGYSIDLDYMDYRNGLYICTDEFVEKYFGILHKYTDVNKILVCRDSEYEL